MGKRDKVDVQREQDELVETDGIEIEYPISYDVDVVAVEQVVERTESVQSLFPAIIKRIGQKTGKQYVWVKAGAIVNVETDDVPGILASRIGGKGCCGGSSRGNELFRVVLEM